MTARQLWTLLGFVIVAIVLLIAAAKADEAQPQCIGTEDQLLATMKENGVAPMVSLTGAATDMFKQWVSSMNKGAPVSSEVNHVLIFRNGDNALVTWFKDQCLVGYGVGPWEPLAKFLGIEGKGA